MYSGLNHQPKPKKKELRIAIRELYLAIKTRHCAKGWSIFHYWIWRVNRRLEETNLPT